MYYDQQAFDIRCEWGEHGVMTLAQTSQAVIIVDVLSFSTSVEIAVHQGAVIFPYRGRDEQAAEFAASVNAKLAVSKRSKAGDGYSLSPASLSRIPAGTRLVIPSPNGATLSLAAGSTPVLAGCLRNARAVAAAAQKFGPRIAVIPAGERWRDDYSLRPSFEDLIGAGAIISYLNGSLSPEAAAAAAAFQAVQAGLGAALFACSSGRELVERDFAEDVELASRLNASDTAPILVNGAFVQAAS
jgi:2-phosphosulfolactate phosphatase